MNFMVLFTPTDVMLTVIVSALAAFPCSMILKRLGFSPWWALTCFVPAAIVLFLWYLALTRWPTPQTANLPDA